jgi:hypothetical protein
MHLCSTLATQILALHLHAKWMDGAMEDMDGHEASNTENLESFELPATT